MLEKLKKIGLTGNQAKTYLALLGLENASGNELAKKVSLDRSVTYNVLNNLIEKGLVKYIIKNKKKIYTAVNPENLLRLIKEKELLLKEIIPKLKQISKIKIEKKKVEVYEGKEGLKSFHLDVLKNKEIKVINVTGKIYQVLKYNAPHIMKKYSKKKVKIIAFEEVKKTPFEKALKKSEFRFLPTKYLNYATTFIYGNKIGIQIITDKPLIIVIENKKVAEGYKKNFDFIWEKLK